MQQLALRTGVTKSGEAWIDHHFADTSENSYSMSEMLTNLVIWQQFLCNTRELATALGRLPPAGRTAHWTEGRGIQPNLYYQQGVTLRAELAAAEKAAEAARLREQRSEQLAKICGLPRVPKIGDYFRTGVHGNFPTYHDKDLEFAAGKVNPRTVFGPILDVNSYRRDTDEECYMGFSVMYEDKGPRYRDPNQQVDAQGEIWIMISENSRLICELVEGGKKSIWDDADTGNAEEPASSSKREVTPSITEASSSSNTVLPSGSQQPPTQTEAKEEIDLAELAQKIEEQEFVDSLEDALDVDMPEEVIPEADSAAPVEKRRRKKRNKIELPEGPPVVEDPYQGQPIPAE